MLCELKIYEDISIYLPMMNNFQECHDYKTIVFLTIVVLVEKIGKVGSRIWTSQKRIPTSEFVGPFFQ